MKGSKMSMKHLKISIQLITGDGSEGFFGIESLLDI